MMHKYFTFDGLVITDEQSAKFRGILQKYRPAQVGTVRNGKRDDGSWDRLAFDAACRNGKRGVD
jgi:hypothetical protein